MYSRITAVKEVGAAKDRLLASAGRLDIIPMIRSHPLQATAFAFAGGFILGFFPSTGKCLTKGAAVLFDLWLH